MSGCFQNHLSRAAAGNCAEEVVQLEKVTRRDVDYREHAAWFAPHVLFFFTLVTGPRRSLSLELSDTRVYEPQTRAHLVTTALFYVQPGSPPTFSVSALFRLPPLLSSRLRWARKPSERKGGTSPHGWNQVAPFQMSDSPCRHHVCWQRLAPNPGAKMNAWDKLRIANWSNREGWWGGGVHCYHSTPTCYSDGLCPSIVLHYQKYFCSDFRTRIDF